MDLLILFLILVVALVLRLYKLDTPLADLHSWRQADTSAVTRNYTRTGIDLLHPQFDDTSSEQSGIQNPKGYRFVEFPFYNAVVAFTFRIFPVMSVEMYGRLISGLFSLLSIIAIYYLALKESGRIAAISGSLIFATFPFFVFFSRVILPEPTATALAMTSILFLYLSITKNGPIKKNAFFVLSILTFALSMLVKPPTIFYGIPLLYLFISHHKFSIFKKIPVYFFFLLAGLPLLAWRLYIRNYPEGIPPSDWLFASVNTYEGLKNIFLRPAFFRWIFFERINNIMMGGYLAFFFVLGIISKQKRIFLHMVLLAAFVYLFVFEGGNVQHEYYQTIVLPPFALFVGLGIAFIIKQAKLFIHSLVLYPVLISCILLSLFFSYYRVKEYYTFPAELPPIAKIVNTLTTPEDRIITDRSGDTTLLYLIDRKGSPGIYKDIWEMKQLGYTHLVTLHKDLADQLKKDPRYTVLFENDQFSLFKL